MVYTGKMIAEPASVGICTLHYYDQIGLLKLDSYTGNGYGQYGEESVLRLQQIMFFHELDFSLDEIK